MMRQRYRVYSQLHVASEHVFISNGDNPWFRVDPWVFRGETYAVSEGKAINNVRFRTKEDGFQHLYDDAYPEIEAWLEWKAVAI